MGGENGGAPKSGVVSMKSALTAGTKKGTVTRKPKTASAAKAVERKVAEGKGGKPLTERVERERASLAVDTLLRDHGYRAARVLGDGAYSSVRRASRTADGASVALKVIDRNKASHRFLTFFLPRELHLSTSLKHPHLVACMGHFSDERYTCLVLELMPKGDLEQYIALHGPFRDSGLKSDKFRFLMRDILKGVAFLHSKNVSHRDLKCENILLGHRMEAKVADLGFAREAKEGTLCETYCGSKSYAAPEILCKTPYAGPPVDCWSLGIIFYVCLAARFPFDDRDMLRMLRSQKEGSLLLDARVFKPPAANLVHALLRPDPARRLTASKALVHPCLATH